MAGQFDFTSPGAAASDAMTQALVERKALERQNLIDSLSVKASQRADAEAEQQKAYQNYEMQMGRDRNDRERADFLTKNMHNMVGQDISHLRPEDQQLLTNSGLARQAPVMTAPPILGTDNANGTQTPDQAAQMQNKLTYSGTYEDQEKQKLRDVANQIIARQANPEAKRFLQDSADANDGMLSQQDIDRTIPHHISVVSFEGKVPTINGQPLTSDTVTPFGTDTVVKPLRQAVPRYVPPQEVWNPKTNMTEWHDPETGKLLWQTEGVGKGISAGVVNGPKTPQTKENAAALHALTLATIGLQTQSSQKNAVIARNYAMNVVNTWTGPEKVKAMMRLRITNPQAAASAMQQANTAGSWTQDDIDKFNDLSQSAWGPQLRQAYQNAMNPNQSQQQPTAPQSPNAPQQDSAPVLGLPQTTASIGGGGN